jgi:hypothetical protein
MKNIQLNSLIVSLIALMRALESVLETPVAGDEELVCDSADPKTLTWAKVSRLCPQSDWSRIGGKEDLPATDHIFSSPAYRNLFRSHSAREIYVGACPGLARNSAAFKLPLYKISTVAPGRLPERLRELNADEYGSEYIADGQYVDDSDGCDKWFASHIYTKKPPAPNSPVEIQPRALTVHLPVTMTAAAFDAAFDHEIRKAGIDQFVLSAEGAAHFEALGIDPSVAQRHTAYPLGSAVRHSACLEIAIFRIREDSDRLVAIAELVVLRHLGLIS